METTFVRIITCICPCEVRSTEAFCDFVGHPDVVSCNFMYTCGHNIEVAVFPQYCQVHDGVNECFSRQMVAVST